MKPRLSLVTLGVADLTRARAYYEALGLVAGPMSGDGVVFFDMDGIILALYGRDALAAQKEAGVTPILRGLSVEGKRPPRADMAVLSGAEPVGTVSSGNFSPVLQHGIAMAFLDPSIEIGATVQLDARGTLVDATVVEMPFITKAS